MIVVGEINDEGMAREIIFELDKRNIKAYFIFHQELSTNVLAVEKQEDLEMAHDLYRVKLGIKKPIVIDPEWEKIHAIPLGPNTKFLIQLCVVIYVLSFFKVGKPLYDAMMINEEAVMRGQVWRLFTPALLHMSFLHILFNVMWLKDLGNALESSFGKYFFYKFILVTALISNLMQFATQGPSFGGMSGVIYGMLGFIWVYKNLNPTFQYSLPKADVYLMIFWFILCLVGVLSMIANMAHAGGLVVGIMTAVFINFEFNKERVKYFFIAVLFLLITVMVEAYKLNGKFYITKWV